MSFSKTISTIAALASIFGAAAAGWKLAESNSQQPPSALDQRIEQLEKQLEDATKAQPVATEAPQPMPLPAAPAPVLTPAPKPATLPPVAPPPPPVTETQQ